MAFKIPKKEDPAGADDKDSDAAKDEQPASPKPTQDQGNGEASAEILPRTSPAAGATTSHEDKSDETKKIDAFGALMTTKKEKKEQKPKKEKKEKKEKMPKKEKRPADETTTAEKPKKRRKKKDAGVADTKSADDDAGAEKVEPEKKAEAAVLDAVIDAEVAALEPAVVEPGLEEPPAVEAPTAPAAAPTVAPPARRPALDFAEIPDDADPLTSCVLSSLNTNKTPAAKTHASSFLTPGSSGGAGAGLKKLPPAGGMKKPGVKSGLGSGQTSLFGFFKTPAPATNQERGFRAMNTPTTGDFIAM